MHKVLKKLVKDKILSTHVPRYENGKKGKRYFSLITSRAEESIETLHDKLRALAAHLGLTITWNADIAKEYIVKKIGKSNKKQRKR